MAAKAPTKRKPEQIGRIVRTPDVLNNQWRIDGTRIPTYIPWEFFVAGATVEEVLGQYPHLEPPDVLAAIAFEQGRQAEREQPAHATAGDRIVRSPDIMNNQWRVAGTRLPTSLLWACYQAGESPEDIADQYPPLTVDDVETAVAFEMRREADRAQ